MKTTMMMLALVFAVGAHADDTTKGDMNKAATDVKVDAKKAGRTVKDKTCELVNGKMECAAKKAGHKVQNAADDLKK